MHLTLHPAATLILLILSLLLTSSTTDDERALREWEPAAVVSDQLISSIALDSCFRSEPISDAIFRRISGKSYPRHCTVPRSSLRYLRMLHRNADGATQLGELICHESIASDLLSIFRTLYLKGYRIERMVLIDNYNASDEASMTANNTSCFNFRTVAGSSKLSKHSQGLAIDINPLFNPCVNTRTGKIEPPSAKPYAYSRTNRSATSIQMIDRRDLCRQLFAQHGFRWGGDWRTKKDYQHFEK